MKKFIKHPLYVGIILLILSVVSFKYIEPNLPNGNILPYLKYILLIGMVIYGYYNAFKDNSISKQLVFDVLISTILLIITVAIGILDFMSYWVERLHSIDSGILDLIE